MFIPFAGHWINPAHITRMQHLEGKRLTICLADGHAALTEYAEPILEREGQPVVGNPDETFKMLMTRCLHFRTPTLAERAELELDAQQADGVAQATPPLTPMEPTPGAMEPTMMRLLKKRRKR